MHGFWFIWWFVIIGLVLIILFVIRPGMTGTGTGTRTNRSSALDILNERYAKGEISRDEFLEKKKDITV